MKEFEIPYYQDYISAALAAHLMAESIPVDGVNGLRQVGKPGGLENADSFRFLCELYQQVKPRLNQVLNQRKKDREFIDQRTRACFELNQSLKTDLLDPDYQTILGMEDAQGRMVIGPKNEFYAKRGYGKPVAPIPPHLEGFHVTLFGPPDDAKLSINAMNAFHRQLPSEPSIISELLAHTVHGPKWGADDEDSKTPLRQDLIEAGKNLSQCFDKTLKFEDPKSHKTYELKKDTLALPIKRFPGLALPCTFLFYQDQPIPLHLYDFALHLYQNWRNPEALAFYVPKLENEEEAAYIHFMIESAEALLKKQFSEYSLNSIRLFIVLENPRAIFRTNEIMDALYPYFAGASLGWHDYLASTARLLKEDGNYRIPVKADPNIVIQYIKASHDLLAEVVGTRGGIKIGGMYGILPLENDLASPSFQITMQGFIKDVVTQLKRKLSGFWVAHPDFVRIGMALVQAWKHKESGNPQKLEILVTSLLQPEYRNETLAFIHGPDIQGLELDDPRYPRSLIVADLKESKFIANHDPEEIRYNVFQSLQYLTDWLSGNGCVALPAMIKGVPVRVMDDLATAERSRWEVWHEIYHGRVSIETFLKIAHEEMHFIRKDLSDSKKIVQVKYNERTEKWYPIAMQLMIQLMTDPKPVEFATELLMPFTIDSIRNQTDPLAALKAIDPHKYSLASYTKRFDHYFSICGEMSFAKTLAQKITLDLNEAEHLVQHFTLEQINEAARFHGDIGESKKTLDTTASAEQALVLKEGQELKDKLKTLGAQYLQKFGFKYLVSAQGRTGPDLLQDLTARLSNTRETELNHARQALWQISKKRIESQQTSELIDKLDQILKKHKIVGAQIALCQNDQIESLCLGKSVRNQTQVTPHTWFELASLSKTLGTCFALEYFKKHGISLDTSVDTLLATTDSSFRIGSPDVKLMHLMNHQALNMHYVEGVKLDQPMPRAGELITQGEKHGYPPIAIANPPGTKFQYSGGGFLVLEHLLEALEKKPIQKITENFLKTLHHPALSFDADNLKGVDYAHGYLSAEKEVEGGRLKFPAFAAGAMGTAAGYAQFLLLLAKAYRNTHTTEISHDTAIQMLRCTDRSSQSFMGVNIGLGVFTAEAGPNRLAIHQGANDGFRCLSIFVYDGPDQGKGFVILCNGDNQGVGFVAETAQALFQELTLQGVNLKKFNTNFDPKNTPQEEIVNRGYKELIFKAFEADLPEAIERSGEQEPLANFNLAVGAKILEVSNQGFARAENLISPGRPVFDPELYGRQGKVMDSWETVRHNPRGVDSLVLELKTPSAIHFVSLSTQYHLGNQAPEAQVEGRNPKTQTWHLIIPRTHLEGHAIKKLRTRDHQFVFDQIRVSMFPDGGLTRLGLYAEDLPTLEQKEFLPIDQAKCISFSEQISAPHKPLTPKYSASPTQIKKNQAQGIGAEINLASQAYGARIVHASNEHYGPASQLISPYPPIHMFDGFESARSRTEGHTEEVTIALGKAGKLQRIEAEFTYFKHNNPVALMIQGWDGSQWLPLVSRTPVKAYAGNTIVFDIATTPVIEQLKVTVFPDGGINRLRAFGQYD